MAKKRDNKLLYGKIMIDEFQETPLGYHIKKNKNNINKINAFWMWQYHLDLWDQIGSPDPFDDNDISILQMFKANMNLGGI